ncbi:uncharacterized protein LOC5511048 [Nematostella vectensis]|nr:uncharacterized protein LOC5511048 [Nematostella vectensis]
MFRLCAIALFVSGLTTHTNGVELEEAVCRPRPTVISIDDPGHNYKPYQVVLHRCSGTCGDSPPNIKTCFPKTLEDVPLQATDIGQGVSQTVYVKNHTSCMCDCAEGCTSENAIRDKNCRCICLDPNNCSPITPAQPAQQGKREEESSIPMPYLIGMALIGFFAVFVLMFDALLCAKKRGFMYTVKHSCGSHSERKELVTTTQNGKCITTTV